MKIYLVKDLANNTLGIFSSERLARASIDLTCAKVPEQKLELEVVEWPVYEQVEHL